MDENKDKPKNPAEKELQIEEDREPELRDLSEEDLTQVLEEHEEWLKTENKEDPPDALVGANLQKVNLTAVRLRKAALWRTDFQNANLDNADLSEANLFRANLQNARLGLADLREAILEKADLRKSYLGGADLSHANLVGADLRGADLTEANLQGADLTEAKLQNAILYRTELNGTILFDTNFDGVNCTNAVGLAEAKLLYSNLEGSTVYVYHDNDYDGTVDGYTLTGYGRKGRVVITLTSGECP